MCNQRERLIGYIYNEGDAAELREVKQHLDECAECRTEVGALRNVRDDLLSWDVPPTESVWRPFAVAPVASVAWWRQVPAWTLAAAASVVLIAGFAGGVVAQGFAKESTVVAGAPNAELDALRAEMRTAVGNLDARLVRSAAALPATGGGTDAMTAEITRLRDLNAVLRAEMQTAIGDLDARLVRVSTSAAAPVPAGLREGEGTENHAELIAEIAMLRELNDKLVQLVNGFDAQWEKVWRTVEMNNGAVNDKVRNLEKAVLQIAQSPSK